MHGLRTMTSTRLVALALAFCAAACGDRQAVSGGDAGQGSDSSQATVDDGGEGYEFSFCEKGKVLTTRCTGGICDPAPFTVCADGSCVLEPATCDEAPVPGAEIDVTIRNGGAGTIYLDGLSSRPFSIVREADGALFNASSLMARGTCDTCDQLCADNMHGDPAPCYLELAAGAVLKLRWTGELRSERPCEPCGALCYEATPIAPGDYDFVVAYRAALDQPGYDFKPIDCSVNSKQGLPSWLGDGIGLPDLDQQAEIAVSYVGQTELLLEIE